MPLSPAEVEREVEYTHSFLKQPEFIRLAPEKEIEAAYKELLKRF